MLQKTFVVNPDKGMNMPIYDLKCIFFKVILNVKRFFLLFVFILLINLITFFSSVVTAASEFRSNVQNQTLMFEGAPKQTEDDNLKKMVVQNQWTIDKLLKEGAGRNPRTASGVASAVAASLDSNAAWQEYLPTPSLQVRVNKGGKDETVLSLSQPLWTGGRISGAVDAAAARAESANAAVIDTQYNLSLSVISYFQNYCMARARQKVLTDFARRLAFYRVRIDNRVASGASPVNDSKLLDVRIAANASLLRAAQEAERVALTQLSQITGIHLTADNTVIVPDNRALPDLNETLKNAERYTPSLVRLESDLEAAKADVKNNRGVLLPTVSLVAQHTISHGNSIGTDSTDSNIGLQVSLTPGAGISGFSKTKAAQERVYALMATRDAVHQELEALIRQNYEQLASVINRQTENKANARAAAAVLASYERLFVASKRSWQDVMNAARDLSDAELAVADTMAERLGTRYRLDVYGARYNWIRQKEVPEDVRQNMEKADMTMVYTQ